MKKNRSKVTNSKGFGILAWPLIILAVIVALLLFTFLFYEARKAYWDYTVREMCRKDGGVKIYEALMLSKEEYERLSGRHGISLPMESSAKNNSPYFRKVHDIWIRKRNPEVVRGETLVIRRSDGKVLGRSVQYWRRGGDFPTGLFHDSSFICPQNANLSKQLFRVEAQR